MSHSLGWKDNEICQLLCDGEPAGMVDIYEFKPCRVCGVMLKLRQVNEILEQAPAEAPSPRIP